MYGKAKPEHIYCINYGPFFLRELKETSLRTLSLYYRQASTCHIERKKTKRDDREVSILAVLADSGRGGGESIYNEESMSLGKIQKYSFYGPAV